MKIEYFHDTITAISTPIGAGAISIVRISGDKAIEIASKLFYNKKVNLIASPSHRLHFGKIIDPSTNQIIDEVLLSIMKAEKSFTREDLVEINCHGGEVIPYTILKLVISMGARLADPGEFTKRAFLNGGIDLTQAEAIHDIIQSRNKMSSIIAVSHLEKRFSKIINQFRDELVHILAHIEVSIDYPEDELEEVEYQSIKNTTQTIINKINDILADTANGKILKQGFKLAIVGKTNVGKSSLFNYFAREDKAIVSHIHGTTRDYLENHINLLDIPIHLIDTAGFRDTDNEIEILGKEKSKQMMDQADFILWLVDHNRIWDQDDEYILNQIDQSKVIFIINKIDLDQLLDHESISNRINPIKMFSISLLKNMGLKELEQGLKAIFLGKDISFNEQSIICNLRQENLLFKAKTSLEKTIDAIDQNLSYEFIALDLRESLNHLGEIVGEVTTDDVLNEIFNNFCIGK